MIDTETQDEIPFTTIATYIDSLLVDGASADGSGRFSINLSQAVTHLRVSSLGYKTFLLYKTDIDDPVNIVIELEPEVNFLDEVTINAQKTTTQFLIDRKVVNLGADLQQAGINVLEAIDQIPEINSDLGTGNISLRGDNNVRLLVNGKPSSLAASEILAQIPTSSVDRIEIITSPSAKYQASGLSGIINIILKRNLENGLNLNLNAAIGTKRYNYGIDGNYKTGILNFRYNASFAKRDMDSEQRIHHARDDGFMRTLFTPHNFNGEIGNYNVGFDLLLDAQNELSIDHYYTHDYHSFFNNTFYTEVSDRDDYIYTRNSSHTHQTSIFNTNYRRSFDRDGHFLEVDYNYSRNNNDLPAIDFEEDIFLFEEERNNENVLQDFALDYALPISDQMLLEAGTSWNRRVLNSTLYTDAIDSAEGFNSFDYSENIKSIFTQFNYNYKSIKGQVGLRYEHFYADGVNTIDNSVTELNFSDFFPFFHITFKNNERNTINVGYSRRISRPNFHHINPFQSRNQYFQWIANPVLEPEYSDNIELNFQRIMDKVSFSSTLFYRYHNNIIVWLYDFDEQGVQSIDFDNVGSKNAYGIETQIKADISDFWNSKLSYNYYYSDLNQDVFLTWDRLHSSSILVKNTFNISNSISSDITYRYSFKDQREFNFIEPRSRLDWAVRIKMLDNRLTANLRITDVLDNNLMHRNTKTENVEQREIWRFQSQTFGFILNVNYKLFQKSNKTRKRKKRNYEHGGATD